MKREDVKQKIPGLTDEQLQWLMDENGADVAREIKRAGELKTELETAKAQLKTAQDGLAAFDGVDVNDLQSQIEKLKGELAAQADGYAYLGDQRPPSTPVRLTQYDQTLPLLAVRLLAGGQPYAVPEGGAVNVRLKKPDGTYVYNPALGVDSARSTAYIAVTPQMTICAGRIAAVLEDDALPGDDGAAENSNK